MVYKRPRLQAVGLFLISLTLFSQVAAAEGSDESARSENTRLLVDTEWLSTKLDDRQIMIVEFANKRAPYSRGHIPGAVFLDFGSVMKTVDGVPSMMPDPGSVAQSLESIGIGNSKTVIVYDRQIGQWAARLFWTLEYIGHPDVRLLNGGIKKWIREGRDLNHQEPEIASGQLTIAVRPQILADKDWLENNLNDSHVQLIDTRSKEEFRGIYTGEPRIGHMPKANHINWTSNITGSSGVLLPKERLAEVYSSVSPKDSVVTYCRFGVRAAQTYFALRYLGYSDVRVYDGSWAEWGSDSNTPIER